MPARSRKVKLVRLTLWERQEGKCSACGEYVPYAESTLDHTFPQSKGGRTTVENGTMQCAPCNRRKGSGGWEEL